MTTSQAEQFFTDSFGLLDKDHNGFITFNEAPTANVVVTVLDKTVKPEPTVVETRSGPQVWLDRFDVNKDGKVDLGEYVSASEALFGRHT